MKRFFFAVLFCSAAFCFADGPIIDRITVAASSALSDSQGWYPAQNLIDQSWRSWAEGVRGSGIGEYFTLTLDGNHTISGFALKNGYGNLDHYNKNNRVKSFKIYADGNYIETVIVKDSIGFELYVFKKPLECEKARFVIDSVYPGTMYDDTCVAEIALLAQAVNDEEFYEKILFWLGKADDIPTMYSGNSGQLSVADADKINLLDYMPFDLSRYSEYKTKQRA